MKIFLEKAALPLFRHAEAPCREAPRQGACFSVEACAGSQMHGSKAGPQDLGAVEHRLPADAASSDNPL